jgi:tetratricopeptide (TPR) repeat protein
VRFLVLFLGNLALLGLPSVAQPDSLDRQFEAATAAYEQGRYVRAAAGYQKILGTGHASAALYYNLGNAYVRLDRLGEAIRYYEKARRLRPNDPRLHHNLEQARRQAGVYPSRLPPRGLAGLVQNWSPLAIFVAGWLLLGSGLAVAVVWTRPTRDGVGRHPLVWGPVAGGLLLAAVALGTSYAQSTRQRAVVVAERPPLRTAPAPDAIADTTLPEGTLLEVQARRAQWTEVRLADGTVGWIPARALGDI